MAIDKAAPDGFKHIIDMTADEVGKQFIPLFRKDCWKFERNGYGYIDEDWVVNECMDIVMGKMVKVFEEKNPHVVDRIRNHPILDQYLKDLEDEVYSWMPMKPSYSVEPAITYRTMNQQLREVGMRQSDFI